MPHRFAVCRTSSRCLDGYPYLSTFTAAQDARWPSPQADLTNMAILSDPPPNRQASSICAIMHGLGVYHLPGTKPEVITSRPPATECLHARVAPDAFVVRVWPLDPDSCQMVLALIHRAGFLTAFSRVSSWVEIRCSSSARNRWGVCIHGVWHVLVMHG